MVKDRGVTLKLLTLRSRGHLFYFELFIADGVRKNLYFFSTQSLARSITSALEFSSSLIQTIPCP